MYSFLRRLIGGLAHGSRRRRLAVVLCALVIPALAVYLGTALATTTTTIQQNNALELDGNAAAGNGSSANPAVPNSHDWDNVFQQVGCLSMGTCNGNSIDGATARSFDTDPVSSSSDNIYTGGSTKDGLALSGWLWKQGAPQAKDDIEHAFAAEYGNSQVCDPLGANCVNHQLLFFGADRYSNSGDSDIGFWFFKGQVSPGSTVSGGGFKFSGNHTNGDVLVLSTFQNGGVVPQLAVYKWSCTGSGAACDSSGSLKLIGSSNGADCVNGVDTHGNPVPATTGDFCGTVNASSGLASPWPFTEKSSDGSYVAANKFGAGTFFEGGMDMTNLGLANQCFSSFLAETRSSQSTTATLSDFASGTFGLCSASISTTASTSAVSPGTTVKDTATVTGSGLTNPPFPTSSTTSGDPGAPGTPVSFGICGPSSTSISSCSGRTVTSLETDNLSPTSTQGVSSATTSTGYDTTGKTPGYYCFTASWGGDANYPGGASDNGSVGTECFQIQQISTTTVTTPSDSSGNALSSPVAFGTTLYDNAVVTPSQTSDGSPTGSVAFYLCNPSQVTQSAGNPVCASGNGTALSGNPRTPLIAGANSTASILSSPGVQANTAGTWCFRATYTPDTTMFTTSSDNSTDECVTVNKAPTTTVTAPHDDTNAGQTYALSASGVQVSDKATVSGVTNGGNPTGTVDFWLCGPASPAVTAVTLTNQVPSCAPNTTTMTAFDTLEPLSPVSNSSTDSSTSSIDVTITQVGQYCFYAKFTPSGSNGNYTGSDDGSSEECFTVIDATSTTSAQSWVPNDSGTIAATGGSTTVSGTLSFTLYPDGDCNASESVGSRGDSPIFQQTFAVNAATPQTRTTDTSRAVGNGQTINGSTGNTVVALSGPVTSSGSYSWSDIFTSTNPNVASSSRCESTGLTINNSQSHTP